MQESVSPTIELLSLFHDYSLAIISIILVFVGILTLSIVFNSFTSDSGITTMIEVVWTVIPIIILVFLAIPSLKILYLIDDNEPYVTLKIIGRQWYWTYEIMDLELEFDSYMINSPSTGEFRLLDVDHRVVLPVQKNIRGLVTGADVIHSWALPAAGVKSDAVPGRLNQVNFNIMRSRILYGQCSEICGANHSFMPIVVEGVSLNKFFD